MAAKREQFWNYRKVYCQSSQDAADGEAFSRGILPGDDTDRQIITIGQSVDAQEHSAVDLPSGEYNYDWAEKLPDFNANNYGDLFAPEVDANAFETCE